MALGRSYLYSLEGCAGRQAVAGGLWSGDRTEIAVTEFEGEKTGGERLSVWQRQMTRNQLSQFWPDSTNKFCTALFLHSCEN